MAVERRTCASFPWKRGDPATASLEMLCQVVDSPVAAIDITVIHQNDFIIDDDSLGR